MINESNNATVDTHHHSLGLDGVVLFTNSNGV
jgi:hypothetical protein